MPAFFVYLDPKASGKTLLDGTDAMLVYAADGPAALALAVAAFPGNEYTWKNAQVLAVPSNFPFIGWTFTVQIEGLAPVSVVGNETNDTVDEIAALLVTGLNALPDVANASYNASTNTLTAAGAADELGDQALVVTILDANGNSRPDLVGTIVDEGDQSAALTVVLPADAAVGVWKKLKQQ